MTDTLALTLDERRPQPLQRQLYEQLRRAILAGRLRPGERLPSTRALAQGLAVARNTVALAYDQLLAEGYLEARVGSGTYVSARLPEEAFEPLPNGAAERRPTDDRARAVRAEGRPGEPPAVAPGPPRRPDGGVGWPAAPRSRWIERVRDLPAVPTPDERPRSPLRYDFRPGAPDWPSFPRDLWRRLVSRRWSAGSADFAYYGDPAGERPLREQLAAYLARSRGVRCAPEQVVIVNGTQQAIDLLARVWLDPGDPVAIEEPGYPGARFAFAAHGATVRPVPVDEQGLCVAALGCPSAAGPAPRLVYVTPSHQYPTGETLSLPRRLALLEWAAQHGALVLEDDYDSEFRYAGRPLEALQGLDRAGVVAYVGSCSKVLLPPLRLGYVVVPPPLVRPLVAAKWLADRQTPGLEQQVLADFLAEGHFERHLRRTRRRYAARRDALLAALRERLGGQVRVSGSGGGLHLVAWLERLGARPARPEDEEAVARAAAELGVGVYPIGACYAGQERHPALLLGFAGLTEAEIQAGVRLLAAAVERVAAGRG